MSGDSAADGTADARLAEIARLLTSDPRLAADQAAAVLERTPGHPAATLLLGIARRSAGDVAGSIATLDPLVRSKPDWAAAHCELGRSLSEAGDRASAIAALRRALKLQPALPGAWHSLAVELRKAGDAAGADSTCAERIRLAARDPRLLEAQAAMNGGRLSAADNLLRRQLDEDPTDVVAMRMLAEVALMLSQAAPAASLLQQCLELAPGYPVARYQYAIALHLQGQHTEALREIGLALASEPRNPAFRNVQAVLLGRTGDFDRAIAVYADLLGEHPRQPRIWMSYGHVLIAAGHQAEGIAAYRNSIGQYPQLGEVWWSLANLKTFRFTAPEVAGMQRQLDRRDLSADDRLHFEFALGKASRTPAIPPVHSHTTRRPIGYVARRSAMTRRRSARTCNARRRCSRRSSSPRGPAVATLRRTRSSSSACRVRARHCWSRSCPAIPPSRGRWNCRT